MPAFLTSTQRSQLEALAQRAAEPRLRRRAQLLLLYDDGLPTRVVAQRVGLSRGRTRFWRKAFHDRQLGIFPAALEAIPLLEREELAWPPAVETAAPAGETVEAIAAAGTITEALPAEPRQPPVEPPAGSFVHRLALTIFDATQPVHLLPATARAALASAGINGSEVDLSPAEEGLRAALARFKHGKARRRALNRWDSLPPLERQALALTALLRLASALDASHSQTISLCALTSAPGALQLYVSGPHAQQEARAAEKRGVLWTELYQQAVSVTAIDPQGIAPLTPAEIAALFSIKRPGVLPEDTLTEAGVKVLRFQFAEMLRHEAGTRHGEDIEELHDMRVATRRLRAAFEVFSTAFDPRLIKPHLKGTRATGRALGRVRDLDVFMEKAAHYLDSLPQDQRGGLDPLLQAWQNQRAEGRTAMLAYLDSPAYLIYQRSFYNFLATPPQPPETDQASPAQVRYIVPVLVYTRLAAVRAYAPRLPSATIEELHGLRIEFKKLRYTLEFFREVLGPEAKEVIHAIKSIQDHLGDLNDAHVACQILRDFLDELEHHQQAIPMEQRQNPEPIVAYLAARHAERHRLMVGSQAAWERFDQPERHVQLALAISVL
jgi:CHAD domain-containing protein